MHCLGIGALVTMLWSSSQTVAIAEKRSLFGASPQTIERYFGPYWSRLTRGADVTYTYSPNRIRQVFPEANITDISVVFSAGKATRIGVNLLSGGLDLQTFGPDGYPQDFDALFTQLFGYQPSRESSVYGKVAVDYGYVHGTLQVRSFCVSDGISLDYEYASVREYAIYAAFVYRENCKETE